MQALRNKVDSMHNGNIESILSCISSANDYLVMNAILCGAKLKLKDKGFIAGVEKAQSNEAVLLGFPLKSVAEAAMIFITGKEYKGNDDLVKTLIKNEFNI